MRGRVLEIGMPASEMKKSMYVCASKEARVSREKREWGG